MLTLYINEFLAKKGYRSTAWGLRKIGMPVSAAYKLTGNRVKSVKLEHLELICKVFDCTPNDLLNYQPENKNSISPGHSLLKICKSSGNPTPMELIKQLRPEEIEQARIMLEGLLKNRKGEL
jgi:DNA-binding Xre family transcriptional regulator